MIFCKFGVNFLQIWDNFSTITGHLKILFRQTGDFFDKPGIGVKSV